MTYDSYCRCQHMTFYLGVVAAATAAALAGSACLMTMNTGGRRRRLTVKFCSKYDPANGPWQLHSNMTCNPAQWMA
jgi:hypothetical protein